MHFPVRLWRSSQPFVALSHHQLIFEQSFLSPERKVFFLEKTKDLFGHFGTVEPKHVCFPVFSLEVRLVFHQNFPRSAFLKSQKKATVRLMEAFDPELRA